ncbi:CpaF family protein [Sneathiella aquimaris]|uniref:CpaF family protein n=1 Tax=Sneathiella aquimaris TaxID=2599305 RepID=UPI00146EB4F5|nr:CpaF family protein [Sneathiella aquimaris]
MFGRKNETDPETGFRGLQDEAQDWIGAPLEGNSDRVTSAKSIVDPELSALVREQFFKIINPAIALALPKESLSIKVIEAVAKIVDQQKVPLNWQEQSQIATELLNDLIGLGPIEALLQNESVTDILVNGPDTIFIEKNGQLEQTDLSFRDEAHLLQVARRIAISAGRRIDESSPMVDARLVDGSRVNIIIPPLSVCGTVISIRKFPSKQINLSSLVQKTSLTELMADFLKIAAKAHLNILISGGTGAGKTTVLNALSGEIGVTERVVTIEDAAEIDLQQPHVISLETRQKNSEGAGEVCQRDLLRNALRMRPDRIIIGEVRGNEVHEMLQAMNTGHDGSMSTIHANSARDALLRVEDLLLSYQQNFNAGAVKRQIASALDLIVHVARDYTGHRYIHSITEVSGLEGDVITTQDLFTFERTTGGDEGIFEGDFVFSKIRPCCEAKVRRYHLGDALEKVLNNG